MTSKASPSLIHLTKMLLSSDPSMRINENGLRNHDLFMEIDW
jgi:hypothetical protein